MACTESRKRKLEEYEMQLFGFHSRAVYATLKGIVQDRIQCRVKQLCESIEKMYNQNFEKLATLRTNKRQLERAYHKGAIPHLKHMEHVVNKYIAVPSNILLEEDLDQRVQYTDSEFKSMNQNLEELQRRAKRATILNAALKEELQAIERFAMCEESVSKMCNSIDIGLTCSDVNNSMFQLLVNYKEFTESLADVITDSDKLRYNTIDSLKCKDWDFDGLSV